MNSNLKKQVKTYIKTNHNPKSMNKLYKSNDNNVFSGVCGGIGEYFDIDPVIIRIIFILFAIFTVFIPTLLVYIILIIIIPNKPKGPINITPKKLKK